MQTIKTYIGGLVTAPDIPMGNESQDGIGSLPLGFREKEVGLKYWKCIYYST
jgi:hypothetical protein